jgi:hypothetical protein
MHAQSGAGPRSKPRRKQVQKGVPAPSALQKVVKQAWSAVSWSQVPGAPELALVVAHVPPAPALAPPAPALEVALAPQLLRSEQLAVFNARPRPSERASATNAFMCERT